MAKKLYYSMGEVTEMFDVNASLLRYWEEHFPMLKPKRNRKGNRSYTPQDIEVLKRVYHLVKERGMRIEGAKRVLSEERRVGHVASNAELMERLQRVRAILVEVREELKSNEAELLPDDDESETTAVEPTPLIEAQAPATTSASAASPDEKPKARRPRRKRDEGEKELFAFYEQSLF